MWVSTQISLPLPVPLKCRCSYVKNLTLQNLVLGAGDLLVRVMVIVGVSVPVAMVSVTVVVVVYIILAHLLVVKLDVFDTRITRCIQWVYTRWLDITIRDVRNSNFTLVRFLKKLGFGSEWVRFEKLDSDIVVTYKYKYKCKYKYKWEFVERGLQIVQGR